ncbi:MAG TPA: TetR/AcrR family transcriptional regulator [Mesotoga infera]|nr:TetR/AcrR family transcriptional regulator [Mesotoga sp.]HON29306.1 TetR/AcrR family transcriptional regulator [Mesotoga infera]HPD39490.1 TetR/AcrR family transcriptional regulator [Mesotoga infera]HRV02997.1 TetR/AcrR family transcriptional regulator [Mesotoga sp.]
MTISRSERTRLQIKQAAEELFSRLGFEMTSVANICRTCGLSNGAFYRHYSGKDQVFKEIVQDIKRDFESVLSSINGSKPRERLFNLYRSVFDILWNSRRKFRAFHEAEYRFPEVESSVDKAYQEAISAALMKDNDFTLPLKWFFVGSSRFAAIYWILYNDTRVPDSTVESLVNFTLCGFVNSPDFDEASLEFELKRAEPESDSKAKDAILLAAEKLMGRKGYFETSIYDITSNAGYGQGTFYLYFESKEKLLQELVLQANRNLRRTLRTASSGVSGRLNMEIRSYKAFLEFMDLHKELYNIVREAEFIQPETARFYYERLLTSYISALEEARSSGDIRPIDPRDLGVFLMGAGHFMGLDLLFNERKNPDEWNDYLREFAVLISKGYGGACI